MKFINEHVRGGVINNGHGKGRAGIAITHRLVGTGEPPHCGEKLMRAVKPLELFHIADVPLVLNPGPVPTDVDKVVFYTDHTANAVGPLQGLHAVTRFDLGHDSLLLYNEYEMK